MFKKAYVPIRKLAMLTAAAALVLGFTGTAEATEVWLQAGNGGGINVGTVTVTNDGTYLTVVYSVTEPKYEIIETHAAFDSVSDTCDYVPQTRKGNVQTGKFPYVTFYQPGGGVTEVTLPPIPLSELGDPLEGDVLCIAAHAVVALVEKQTAWGAGYEFLDDRNWSMYFTHVVQYDD